MGNLRELIMTAVLVLALGVGAGAQDAYHAQLQNEFQSQYDLPGGQWMFFDTEEEILSSAFSYGATTSVLNASGQTFQKKMHFVVSSAGGAAWDAGWGMPNQTGLQTGDVVLATFYARSQNGPGRINFFIENASTFAKEVYLSLPIDTAWRRYFVPFASGAQYTPGTMNWGFHLATQIQTVEVGGFTGMNFGSGVSLEALPSMLNNMFYEGWEPDAPWRSEAAVRIDSLRKADLSIRFEDMQGQPVADARAHVRMLRHDYAFGTAVTANRLAHNNAYNSVYENKLINLDGQGHGFNWVVFENDLKWPAWEDEWLVNKTELVDAVRWLRDQNIEIRGHNLVWPGTSNLPSDIQQDLDNVPYILHRINDHLQEILAWPGIEGEIAEWDVLNEIVSNTTLADHFAGNPGYVTGRELYKEIFQKARELDPETGLWLNDYVTLSLQEQPGNDQYDRLKQYTGELVSAGVDIEGLGFQSHIGAFPNGIPSVLATLDDFYDTYGLKAKVTEFDLPGQTGEEVAAQYLRDFLTATFSHPSMNGFFFWSFWDGATYMNKGANLFRDDWTLSKPGEAFIDLVFHDWWTDTEITSSETGEGSARVFKGLYELSYLCGGELVRDTLEVLQDFVYVIPCEQTSSVDDNPLRDIRIFPNPSSGHLTITMPSDAPGICNVYDLHGRLLQSPKINNTLNAIDLTGYKGVVVLEVIQGYTHMRQRIMLTE